jgi:hypothetical protein
MGTDFKTTTQHSNILMNTSPQSTPICFPCNQHAEPTLHKPDPTEKRQVAIIELARKQREAEGTIEIDDNAILSEGTDNGCYVQAWVWADFSDTPFDKDRNRG